MLNCFSTSTLITLLLISNGLFAADNTLVKILTGESRTRQFIDRDPARHPEQVIAFFEIEPNMIVAEIWPGSGWWSEIFAPYLKNEGQYYAVGYSLTAKRTPAWRKANARKLIQKFSNDPKSYGKVEISSLSVPEDTEFAPRNYIDRVLTFRNVHNWMNGDYAEDVFHAMYRVLRPGGLLGVVEHRADEGTDIEQMKRSGYVSESYIIALAEKSGFKLLEKSEINSNRRDKKNHPSGVWTLPPSLRHCGTLENRADIDACQNKYIAIGESDRMTLKFIKPLVLK